MSNITASKNGRNSSAKHLRLRELQRQRKRLTLQLAKVQAQISRVAPNGFKRRDETNEVLTRILDEFSEGLPDLPPLPRDFSRTHMYDDHD